MKKLLPLLGCAAFSMSSHAALISVSENFSPVLVVDNATGTTALNFSEAGIISDVNVFIDFTKCDDPILADGTCDGVSSSHNDEISFSLTSAAGTVVDLVFAGSYTGDVGSRVGVLFDDSAVSGIDGTIPTTGTFSPVGMLSDFKGENLQGDWTLTFADSVGADPLSVNGWRIDITTVSEPAGIAGFGIALAGLILTRRKTTKVN